MYLRFFLMSMTIHHLPPQAYTKDTLIKAYEWLQYQDEQMKERADSPDLLVSLYMRAQRQEAEALRRPQTQHFQSELRHLARSLSVKGGQVQNLYGNTLESESGEHNFLEKRSGETQQLHNVSEVPFSRDSLESGSSQPQSQSQSQSQPQSQSQSQPQSQSPETLSQQVSLSHFLGESTYKKIKEIQVLHDFSTEQEAVKLLVSVGYHHVKRLLS
jgi:hypothetical protein